MSDDPAEAGLEAKRRRMAEAVRMVLITRERAPRSPAMERALKRLIWRYTQTTPGVDGRSGDEE